MLLLARRSDMSRARIAGFLVSLGVAGLMTGCGLAPDLEDVVNYPPPLKYEPKNLTSAALDDRMKEIDASYAEPRTPTKVTVSYETSMDSISAVNEYAALWRGARACTWLAFNHNERSKREEFAKKGIAISRESVQKAPQRVESFYYLAMCLAAYAEVKGTATKELVQAMRDKMLIAKSLDDKYDYCGPDRFLGQLMVETEQFPLWNIGDMAQGLDLLKKSVDACPDYGENHLVYAKYLIKNEEKGKARDELMKVITSPKPPDLKADHQTWLEEANKLLTEVQ